MDNLFNTGEKYVYGDYETYMFTKRADGTETGTQNVTSRGTSITHIYGLICSYSGVDWTTTCIKNFSISDQLIFSGC